MMIDNDPRSKRIITCGCSFSEPKTPYTWSRLLEKRLHKKNPNLSFDHRGLASQGNELIQKKVIHAINKALKEGYKAEDINVFVMWSGHERRAWYIDNTDVIEMILDHWRKQSTVAFQLQFGDLENSADCPAQLGEDSNPQKHYVPYNKYGGWYINSPAFNELPFFKEYFMLSTHMASIILLLENIVMLQSFCQARNIKLYEQFYMDYVYDEIKKNKDHKEVKHFFELINWNNFINLKSIHGYLKEKAVTEGQYFKSKLDNHPNFDGHLIWTDEVIIPYLEKNNFFSEF